MRECKVRWNHPRRREKNSRLWMTANSLRAYKHHHHEKKQNTIGTQRMVPPQTTDFPPRKILCANGPPRLSDWRLLWISNENVGLFIPAPLPKLTRECWYLSLESSLLPDLANHLLHSYCDVFVIEVQSNCISCNRFPVACIKNPVCGAS